MSLGVVVGRLLDGRRRFGAANVEAMLQRAARRAMPGGVDPGRSDFNEAIERMTKAAGLRAARWIVQRHKQQIHATGIARFHLPAGAELPGYFRRAIDAFEANDAWSVVATRSGDAEGKVEYVVRWKRWGRYARGV